jgi:hypothetical protein
MSIQLDKRSLVHAKVARLMARPESFKFRLAAITATDKGNESFPYGKYTMLKELHHG